MVWDDNWDTATRQMLHTAGLAGSSLLWAVAYPSGAGRGFVRNACSVVIRERSELANRAWDPKRRRLEALTPTAQAVLYGRLEPVAEL